MEEDKEKRSDKEQKKTRERGRKEQKTENEEVFSTLADLKLRGAKKKEKLAWGTWREMQKLKPHVKQKARVPATFMSWRFTG